MCETKIKKYNMKTLFALLSIIAVIIGLVWYRKETVNKTIKPNLIAILATLVFAVTNALTYLFIVKDLYKSSLLIVTILANIIMITIIIKSKNFLWLKRDFYVILACVICVVVLLVFTDTKNAHIIMQVAISLPFVPLIWGVLQKKGKEPLLPWFMILLATIFNMFVVLVEYSDHWSLVHPIRSGILLIILLLSIVYVNSKKWKKHLVTPRCFLLIKFLSHSLCSYHHSLVSSSKRVTSHQCDIIFSQWLIFLKLFVYIGRNNNDFFYNLIFI